MMTAPKPMTKTEREELKRLARDRAKVAKHDAQRRTADLKAMFEQQLITYYDYNRDDVWKAAVAEAEAAVAKAQETISKRCQELGIPVGFAPNVSFQWERTGPYAVQYEQAELRRAAYKRIEAQERGAIAEIDRKALDVQTELVSAGLTSERAIEFLKSMPSIDDLMPGVEIVQLEGPERPSLGMGDDLF